MLMASCLFASPMILFVPWLVLGGSPLVAPCAALLAVACVAAFFFSRLYRRSYNMKEEPVVERGPSGDDCKWDSFLSGSQGPGNFAERVAAYRREFFLNAFVHPRSVFSRINEYISPGRRMLDCDIHFEVVAPSRHGLVIRGLNDFEVRSVEEKRTASCELLIPLGFQRRGGLTISQRVFNDSGVNLPIVKQSDLTSAIIDAINEGMAAGGSGVGDRHLGSKAEELLREYLDNTDCNPDVSTPEEVCREMLASRPDFDADYRRFCRSVLVALVGLKDVIPICVSFHVAALDEASAGQALQPMCRMRSPAVPRIFKLRMVEKREMVEKPTDIVHDSQGKRFAASVNELFHRATRNDDTIYYNVANAGRSTSYHLHVEGPENTYYARGSLMRQNATDRREIFAKQVEVQKRCGQRNAHLYIRSGHRMANTTFMFRFRKAPLDSYHIMFVAALLCLTVLSVCLIGSLSKLGSAVGLPSEGDSVGFSAVSMLLAVVSAAGSWIYGRAWDGREEGIGIMTGVFATIACSVVGMVLNGLAFAGLVQGDCFKNLVLLLWCVLISTMVCITAMVGYIALLHGALYRYLLAKDPSGEHASSAASHRVVDWERDDIVDDSSSVVEDGGSMRVDTPRGRYVTSDYCLWKKAVKQFEARYGVRGFTDE